MNEINWKYELLDSAVFNKKQDKLLKMVPSHSPIVVSLVCSIPDGKSSRA
tara:strand:+ start:135 stop:284 length:150 start_codon:yes stop_codon:yes gene_type:complete